MRGRVTLGETLAGIVRNRSGDVYKPSVLRGYEQSLRARLLPALGGAKLGDIRRSDVQRLVNRMMADGIGASTFATPCRRCARSTAKRSPLTRSP